MKNLFKAWPVVRQLTSGRSGDGAEAMSERTRALQPRHAGASVARSVCPYCGVGCGQLVFHRDGKLVSIEGDPAVADLGGPSLPEGRRQLRAAHACRPR